MTRLLLLAIGLIGGAIFLSITTNSIKDKNKIENLEQKLEIAETKLGDKTIDIKNSIVQKFDGLRFSVSQEDLNKQVINQLSKQPETPNKIVDGSIKLKEGVGEVTLVWEKGQTLTAEVIIGPDGKRILVQKVVVEGAGILNSILETVAQSYIQGVFEQVTKVQGRYLNGVEITEGNLVIYYAIDN